MSFHGGTSFLRSAVLPLPNCHADVRGVIRERWRCWQVTLQPLRDCDWEPRLERIGFHFYSSASKIEGLAQGVVFVIFLGLGL